MTAIPTVAGQRGLLVLFALEDRKFALHLPAVDRVLRAVEITPLPDAPHAVLGVINVHGRVIPVFDLRARFGFPRREMQLNDHIIAAHTATRTVGLLVDRTIGVVEYDETTIVPAGDILPGFDTIEGAIGG